jgi:hypothetical protein
MRDVSLLPFVPDVDPSEQTGADVCDEADNDDIPRSPSVVVGVQSPPINFLTGVDTFFFMDYNGKLKTKAAIVLRDAGADAWGINAESDGTFKIHVEGKVKHEDFMAHETLGQLRPFIKYKYRSGNIELNSGLLIGAKLNRETLVATTLATPFLPAVPVDFVLPLEEPIDHWKDIGDHSTSFGHIGDTFGTVGSLLTISFSTGSINVVQTAAQSTKRKSPRVRSRC